MNKYKNSFVSFIIHTSYPFFKNKIYTSTESLIKVNLGCSLRCLPGWINIDGSLTALFGSTHFVFINKILYKLAGSSLYFSFEQFTYAIHECSLRFFDLSRKILLRDNYADFLYSSHFLEHLTKKDGQKFLAERYRTLKPGGLLRISVPDLDYAFKMYQDNKIEDMLGLFFYTSDNWGFAAHKHNYNFSYLKDILSNIGFKEINKVEFQKGVCPNCDTLDIYPEHSLFVECKK
jgi:predicted SAM-dependent methyltransferase